MSEQQPRDSRGHFLRHGAIPYSLEPDAWDDTCRHEQQATEPRPADGGPAGGEEQ